MKKTEQIVELGEPQSIIQYEDEPITSLVTTEYVLNNILETINHLSERMDVLSDRIDLLNQRIDINIL